MLGLLFMLLKNVTECYSRQYRQKKYIFWELGTYQTLKAILSSEPHPLYIWVSKASGEILVSFLFDLSMLSLNCSIIMP